MTNNEIKLAVSYLRLSKEEAQRGESSSITNQRLIVNNYCKANNIVLIREFADDGYSGSNFDRPNFNQMIELLEKGLANMVITKDLSRLGRNMRESSYFAEQYFPERQIQYIAISDNFDSTSENIMAPLQFAMNEVQLRECSRKIKEVLRYKRENGLYCAKAPYGYKKDEKNKNLLVPNEETAPIVQRIFELYIQGYTLRDIAQELNSKYIPTPNAYRIINNGDCQNIMVGDKWNLSTIRNILKNQVYLGHTILGKSKKVNYKSDKLIPVPEDDWSITLNTHMPLIDETTFDKAQDTRGKRQRRKTKKPDYRRSIFNGIVKCASCGGGLITRNSLNKEDVIKSWWLRCSHTKHDFGNGCCTAPASIRYADLIAIVKEDLNNLLKLSKEDTDSIINNVILKEQTDTTYKLNQERINQLQTRIKIIDKIILKLYTDNANGILPDDSLYSMIADLQAEANNHRNTIASFNDIKPKKDRDYMKFFDLLKRYTNIEELDEDILRTFIDRIEVEPIVLPEGVKRTSKNHPGKQNIRIYYKFVGELK